VLGGPCPALPCPALPCPALINVADIQRAGKGGAGIGRNQVFDLGGVSCRNNRIPTARQNRLSIQWPIMSASIFHITDQNHRLLAGLLQRESR